MPTDHPTRLRCDEIRWRVDPSAFDFETTDDVDLDAFGDSQKTAREALLFGIQCEAQGQNVYVRGERGTGRVQMVQQLLDELQPKTTKKCDYCYVHNFSKPQNPRLLRVPPGTGPIFRRIVSELAEFIDSGLLKALDSEPISSELNELKARVEQSVRDISGPLEEKLSESNLALVSIKNGPMTQTVIFPTIDGEPVAPSQFRTMVNEGKVPAEQWEKYQELMPQFQMQLEEISKQVADAVRTGNDQFMERRASLTAELLRNVAKPIYTKFDYQAVHTFLDEIIEHTVEFRLDAPNEAEGAPDWAELYGVNVVLTHADPQAKPVVFELSPSLINMLGTVEPKWGPGGVAISDYRGIRAGAILNADHGYLILDANDVLAEPGAWRALMRTIRMGQLEIVPPEVGWMRQHVVIQPEPIDIEVRVILIGDVATYYMLDRADADFREYFKVLADFDSEMIRDETALARYASVVATLVRDEKLPAFDKTAVAALVEHGARVASRNQKLTARFGRIADLVRESAFLAGQETVTSAHVKDAIRRTKHRAALPSRKFQEMVANKTILVQTQGDVVGQINGLAVMHSGPLTYGFPARITATIGPGRAGLINIEGRAQMSGAIHTKGFHIIGGLLRHLLRSEHPLAFSASLAFEQSYGGIDGDSASGAEVVCLLSALTDIPIRQGMAMTGAIDQLGHLEAIGGVNEKIEGFFDACHHFGLTGEQGVVIPKANQGDLMLKDEVVEACRAGKFHVYAVETIYDAIEVMTGTNAGCCGSGGYQPDSVLAIAVQRARSYWERTLASPAQLTSVATDDSSTSPPVSFDPGGNNESEESAS